MYHLTFAAIGLSESLKIAKYSLYQTRVRNNEPTWNTAQPFMYFW